MAKINNFNTINDSTKRGGSLRIILNNDIDRINEFVNDYIDYLNDHDIYSNYNENSLFPVANDISKRMICLPIYPELTNNKQMFIINQLKLAFS